MYLGPTNKLDIFTTLMMLLVSAFAAFEESPKREAKPLRQQESQDDRLLVAWLQEMPEDLDVFIAQRYFEQAVELIQKSNYRV